MKTKAIIVSLGLVSILAAGALASDNGYDRKLRGSIKIDGSSTVYPITEAVAEEFAGACPKVRVTVGISGTGGGMKRFAAGETDISDASRPIKGKENKIAMQNGVEYIEIPVAYDGLSIVVNKKNTWVDQLTVEDLKKIFLDGSAAKTWKTRRCSCAPLPAGDSGRGLPYICLPSRFAATNISTSGAISSAWGSCFTKCWQFASRSAAAISTRRLTTSRTSIPPSRASALRIGRSHRRRMRS